MLFKFILLMAVLFGLIFSGTGIFQWFLLMILFGFKVVELIILFILFWKQKTFKIRYFMLSTIVIFTLIFSLHGFHKLKQFNVRTEIAFHVNKLDNLYTEKGYYDANSKYDVSFLKEIFMYDFEARIETDRYYFSYYDGSCLFSWIYQNDTKKWFCSD